MEQHRLPAAGVTGTVRVALDATAVPTRPGGAGRYVIDLASALQDQPGLDLTILCRRRDRTRWSVPGMRATLMADAPDPRPLRLVWEQTRLPQVLRRMEVDVLHSPHYTLPAATGTPVVVTVHDLSFFDHPEWHQRTKVAFFRSAIRAAAARATAIVAVSQCTADRLAQRVGPRCPVHVIPHGVDHDRFRPAVAPTAKVSPYVAFLGTIEPRKDVPTLIRAFDAIAADHPDLRLVLAGAPGWGMEAVDGALAASPFRNRIERRGYLSDAAIVGLLQGAAAVAYPSLEEGFGLPALEAMACGAPLVTTTGSAMEEVVEDAALLVAPGDHRALAEAIDASVLGGADVAKRREKGLAIAARHTWAASAEAHLRVYREAAGSSPA